MHLNQFNDHYNIIYTSVYNNKCVYLCAWMKFEISKMAIPFDIKNEEEVYSFVGFDGFIIYPFENWAF